MTPRVFQIIISILRESGPVLVLEAPPKSVYTYSPEPITLYWFIDAEKHDCEIQKAKINQKLVRSTRK